MSEFWNKKKEDLTPIDQGSYLLYSLLLWAFSVVLFIYLPSKLTILLFLPVFIGFGITKRRLIDTDLNYRWRYVYFIGGLGIFLMLFLYFKKSKKYIPEYLSDLELWSLMTDKDKTIFEDDYSLFSRWTDKLDDDNKKYYSERLKYNQPLIPDIQKKEFNEQKKKLLKQ